MMMKFASTLLLVLAVAALVSAEQKKSLSDETMDMLNQLASEAIAASHAAANAAAKQAGPDVVEKFTSSLAAQERDTASVATDRIAHAHEEADQVDRDIEQQTPREAPLFTEVLAGVETEGDSGAVKAVLADLKQEKKAAKGEEKALLKTQIKSMEKQLGVKDDKKEKKHKHKHTHTHNHNHDHNLNHKHHHHHHKEREVKHEKKEERAVGAALPLPTNSNDSLRKLITGLKGLQKGDNNFPGVHALILSTLQEVRIAWEQKRAYEIDRIEKREEALEDQKQQLLSDYCESGECPNDPPVPNVSPLSPFDCDQHVLHFCYGATSQCSSGCWSQGTSTWASPQLCHQACSAAHDDCMRVQRASCGSSFVSVDEQSKANLDVNSPNLIHPIVVPHRA